MSRLSLNLFNVPLSPTNATLENKASTHNPFEGHLNSVHSSDSVCVRTRTCYSHAATRTWRSENNVWSFSLLLPCGLHVRFSEKPLTPSPYLPSCQLSFQEEQFLFLLPFSPCWVSDSDPHTCWACLLSTSESHPTTISLFQDSFYS